MSDYGGGNRRCQAAAQIESPIVTEWSGSEKSQLEGLLAGQAVAVQFSGCDLRVLHACRVPGKYGYRRTTLATDTLEIDDSDELYAKLPLGALRLEGELARSGRIAVRTTVSGQYRLEGSGIGSVPQDGTCGEATHLVAAVSVGAFSLFSGGAVTAGGSVGTPFAGAGAESRRQETLVRQAGDAASCGHGSDATPSPLCASPIQVFLLPLHRAGQKSVADQELELAERRGREQGVLMDIPGPKEEGERWRLFDASARPLCDLPCSRWIPPRSGYYVERQPTSDRGGARIDLPSDLPHSPGTHVTASYGDERGMPFLSKLTFYGLGIPAAIGSAILTGFYLAGDDPDRKAFFLTGAIFYGAAAAASTWWFVYSEDKHFKTKEIRSRRVGTDIRLVPYPFGVGGTF
jgi:hypothetical protein